MSTKSHSHAVRFWLSVAILCLAVAPLHAAVDALAVAQQHVQQNLGRLGLTPSDIAGWRVTDNYLSKHNGLTHVYLQQRLDGIRVWNALINVNVQSDGAVLSSGNRFVPSLAQRVNTRQPLRTPQEAVQSAARYLSLPAPAALVPMQVIGGPEQEIVFQTTSLSLYPIPAKLMYYPIRHGTSRHGAVRLAWNVLVSPTDEHIWSLAIDAVDGSVLGGYDHVNNDTYWVYAWPSESPNHTTSPRTVPQGPDWGRLLQTEARADATASPLGWHGGSIDTTGNNVIAQTDLDNNNAFTPGTDTRPTSPTRDFMFLMDLRRHPNEYKEAAITNLFYWNNVIHDISYLYGFDEAGGNFQTTNVSGEGLGGDPVHADAQDAFDTTPRAANNANFGTPPDGQSATLCAGGPAGVVPCLGPRMQMYLWITRTGNRVVMNSPAGGTGPHIASGAVFGPQLTSTGITGDLVLVNDGTAPTADACEDAVQDLTGKIAVIDRGTCNNHPKVRRAQTKGAIGVIIVSNVPGDPVVMTNDAAVTGANAIPSVMITQAAGEELKSLLATQTVNVTLKNLVPNRDGDLDAGVIVHEYGHGISNRLTGGPATTSCLGNPQQAGEGWSDWFALTYTQRAGSDGTAARGIGSYIRYEDDPAVPERGIRPYPYTTNMAVNPQTYADIRRDRPTLLSVPHGVGSVWATTLWEMYWAIVNGVPATTVKGGVTTLPLAGEGFREDLYNKTAPLGGNQIALQLVMDHLKLQPCEPSFLEGRDALLAADKALNPPDGRFQCHIWYAFAKRGQGVNALDDDGNLAVTEDFHMPPACTTSASGACVVPPRFRGIDSVITSNNGACELNVNWTAATPNCGTKVTYSIYRSTSANFVPGPSNLLVSGLEDVTTYKDTQVVGGTRYYYFVQATDDLGNVALLKPCQTCDFIRKGEIAVGRVALGGEFADNAGDGDSATRFTRNGWAIRSTGGVDNSKVYATSASGNYPNNSCLSLESDTIYLGANSTLTFTSSWATEPAWDGGIVEVSTAAGGFSNWTKLTTIQYPGLMGGPLGDPACGVPGLRDGERAFSGVSEGEFVDFSGSLSAYANQPVKIRFLFGSDPSSNDLGWFIDDIAVSNVNTALVCSTIQFSSPVYSVSEDGGSATIVLTRTGDVSQAQSVTVTSTNGSATAPSDYVTVNASITFPAGQSLASFPISILDDTTGEGPETVTLTLSNPVPVASIIDPKVAVLTINDNDVSPAPVISSLNPPSACQGAAGGLTLTVYGSNFVISSSDPGTYRWATVLVNGVERRTNFVSSGLLVGSLLGSDVASPGIAVITVRNPDGVVSNAFNLPIAADDTAPSVVAPAGITIMQSMCGSNNEGGASGSTSSPLAAFLTSGTASDDCSPTTSLSAQVGGADADNSTFFRVGTTPVTFRFRDASGNTGSASSSVTIHLFGDLNLDTTVDSQDNVIMSNYLVDNVTPGTSPYTAGLASADLNHDGKVDSVDSVILANYLVDNVSCLN